MTKEVRALLDEIESQYKRRREMYRDAGGDPDGKVFMRSELTCYLPQKVVRDALASKEEGA